MKRNLLLTTVSFFILMISMSFKSASDHESKVLKCKSSDIILNLSSPQERIPFLLEDAGWNEVILCNLEIGKKYDLVISEKTDPCSMAPVFAQSGNSRLEINPTGECFYLNINNFCDSKKEVSLSVALQSKSIAPNNSSVGNNQSSPEMVPITTSTALTATELIEDVFIGGGCFDVSNVQVVGSQTGIGSFGNGQATFGFDDGVVITSGTPNLVSGPNTSGSTGVNNGGGSDPDLAQLTSQTIQNATGIEFDFSPTVSAIEFEFVFASDEYCEFVNTQFNDVFGFFISGPGINGTFSNGAENIALIPGTTTGVTINTVNHLTNTAFFNPNSAGCNGTTNMADIEFDGYTQVMTAIANVQPCETYHIKLVVGDGTDAIYDSAVFLKAGSFNAGGAATVQAQGNAVGSNIIYEDCGDGFITFTRQTGDINVPLTITYTILPSSTATLGVDYTPIPLTITIPAGQTEYQLPISAFNDGIPEGIETIILEIDNSCSCINSTAEIQISDVTPIDISGLADQVLCNPQTVTLAPSISGGVPPFTYSWTPGGQNTPTISPFVPSTTTYTVTTIDDCGTIASEDVTIEVGIQPTAFLSGIVEVCPPTNPVGVIQFDFTGVGPWDLLYSIDGIVQPPITGILTNPYLLPVSQVGTYSINEVMAGGCPGPGNGLAVVTETTIIPLMITQDISCGGQFDGEISVFPQGGTPQYSYIWSNPLAMGSNPNGLPAGTYTVSVYDANGCLGEAATIINEPTPLTASATGSTVDCSNPSGGTISVTPQGGTDPLAYVWSNPLALGQNPSGLPAGTYTVTITDLSACTTTAEATIMENIILPDAAANAPDVITCLNQEVSINGNGSSTGGGFTYNWTTNNGTITGGQGGLNPTVGSAGTYQILVTNSATGCTATASVTVAENITLPDAVINLPPSVDCNFPQIFLDGNGSSTGSDFGYQWTTVGGNIVTGQNSLNPTIDQGGSYTLTVTNNATGCAETASVTVTEDTAPPIADAGSAQVIDCNSNTATLSGTGSSLGPNFSYEWTTGNGIITGGELTLFPTVAGPGDYQIEVTNNTNGCTATAIVNVTQDNTLPISDAGTAVDVTCTTTQITLDGSGSSQGTGYTYQWTTGDGTIVNNETTLNPTIDGTGTYDLTVTSPNGCTSISSVTVGENTTPPIADAGNQMNIDCITIQTTLDGSGSSSSSGGNITYLWSTGNGSILSGENTATPTVNGQGTYTLLITDQTTGCTATATTDVVASTDLPFANAGAMQTLNCTQIETTLDGSLSDIGTNITYLWSTGDGNIVSGGSTVNPTVNGTGTYQILVTNTTTGCTSVSTVMVGEDIDPPMAVANAPAAITCTTTQVSLDGNGSSAGSNFTYLWTTGNGNIVSGDNTINPVVNAAGTYEILVTNTDNGCTEVASVNVVTNGDLPTAEAGTADDLTCLTTQLTLNGSGSSGPNITYLWSTNDGNIVSDGETLNPVINSTGVYQLLVTDISNGCTAISTVPVGEDIAEPDVDAGAQMTLDCGTTDVSLNGSSSSVGNFTYLWTTGNGNILSGENTLSPTVNAAGDYTLLITNNTTGCTASASTIVDTSADLPDADAGAPQTLSCEDLETILDGSGSAIGTGITYLWTTGDGNIVSGENTINPTINEPGTYEILVTNTANGCSSIATVIIDENVESPDANATAPNPLTCTDTQVSLDGNGSSEGGNFTYLWTTGNGNILSGENTLTPEVNAAGTYEILVTNTDNGCTQLASIDVAVDGDLPTVDAGTADLLTCNISQVTLNGSSSAGNMTYLWTTGDGNIVSDENTLNPVINSIGTYELLVTDLANGCSAISTVTVEENVAEPNVVLVTPAVLTCDINQLDLDVENQEVNGTFDYTWSTQNGNILSGENTISPTINQEGDYVLEVTNTVTGCTSSLNVNVDSDVQPPLADAGPTMVVSCANTELSLDGSGSASGTNFTYLWTTGNGNIIDGEDTTNPTIGATGDYEILVTNTDNGCTSIANVFVDENFQTPEAEAGDAQTLSCSETSLTLNGNGSSFGSNFTYEWTTGNGNIIDGENTLTPNINAPGDYDLIVTDTENGCTQLATVNVGQDSNVPTSDAGANDLLNCNITSLILDGSGSSSGLGFAYEWTATNGGNIVTGENTLNPEVNAAGVYQLVVTNNINGCTSLSSMTIDLDDVAPMAEAGLTQFLSCANNSLTLDGAGSSSGANYTYEWVTQNGNITAGENTLSPEINATGTYELIVTSLDNGCTTSDFVDITQDSSLPIADAGPGFEITCLVFDGTLDGTGSSIGNDITFEWTTGLGNIVSGENTLTPTVNAAGVYQLTLTNTINGCTAISSVTIDENNLAPSVSAGATMELNCYNENLSLSGTTQDSSTTLIYEWTTGDGNIIDGENTLNPEINLEGTYILTITNSTTGCVSTDQVEITSNFVAPTADAGPTDELNCTQAFSTLNGNSSSIGANFIYQWSTPNGNIVSGENTLTPDVNMPGDYELLVTDLANGCTAMQSVNITENADLPNADAGIANDLTCDNPTYQLDGGNSSLGANFEYSWTTADGNILMGNNTINPTIDEPGTYVLQVTNTSNNCISIAEITVGENIDAPVADAGVEGLITCALSQASLDGGNSSTGSEYTYQWITSNGNIVSGDNSITPTVGGIGTYELIVTNTLNGCTSNAFVNVTSNENLPDAEAIPNGVITCNETTVSLNGSGSSVGNNFTYEWTTTNGAILSGENTLSPIVGEVGDYVLTVFDINNGCSNQTSITVEDDLTPPTAFVDQAGVASLDCVNSSVILDGSGSQPAQNISYQWTTPNGNILSGANTSNPQVDDAGDYILTVTNLTNGCTDSESISVVQDLSVPNANINPPLILTCDLTEFNLDGGNSSIGADYVYQWTTTNGTIVSGANTLTPLINQPGTYQLLVTDLTSNCDNQTSITVLENVTPPIAEAGTADVLDCQTTAVSLNGSQSSSGNNITYQWTTSNGSLVSGMNSTAPSVNAPGSYALLVTNTQNGCTATDFVIVEEDENVPSGIIYTIDQPECHGEQGSIIIETVDGGTAPYLYSIDGVNFYSGHIFTVQAGQYTLYAQDAVGCETQINFEIPDLDPVSVFLDPEAEIELGDNFQIESTTNIPTNEIESITWTPNNYLSCSDCLNPMVVGLFETATFTMSITNIYGCTTAASVTINVDKSRAIYIPNIFTPNEDGENDIFMIYAGDLNQIKNVLTLRIYDRWGEEVFREDDFMPMDPAFGWDGFLRGKPMNSQVFVYWTEIEFIDGIRILYKGDVTLRR